MAFLIAADIVLATAATAWQVFVGVVLYFGVHKKIAAVLYARALLIAITLLTITPARSDLINAPTTQSVQSFLEVARKTSDARSLLRKKYPEIRFEADQLVDVIGFVSLALETKVRACRTFVEAWPQRSL